MRAKLLAVAFCLAFFSSADAQEFSEKIPASVPAQAASPNKPETPYKSKTRTPANNGYVRPNAEQRFKRYVSSVVGPYALGSNAVKAGFATATNSPEEWGGTWEGFGRRFASDMGKTAIKNTTVYALDEAFELDSRFYRSQKRDTKSRLKNALISPFMARNRNGKRVVGIPRIAGTYAASITAAEAWYPARYDYKDGLRSGTISFGVTAAVNLFREFVWKK